MVTTAVVSENFSGEDFMLNLPEHMEWLDGQLIEKTGITLSDRIHPSASAIAPALRNKGVIETDWLSLP